MKDTWLWICSICTMNLKGMLWCEQFHIMIWTIWHIALVTYFFMIPKLDFCLSVFVNVPFFTLLTKSSGPTHAYQMERKSTPPRLVIQVNSRRKFLDILWGWGYSIFQFNGFVTIIFESELPVNHESVGESYTTCFWLFREAYLVVIMWKLHVKNS